MRLRVAAPALVCSSVLAACGGGASDGPDATVRGYIDAIANGNAEQVCGYLTGAALRQRGGADCAPRVERVAGKMTPKAAASIRSLKFEVVSEHDRSATVRVHVPQAPCDAGKTQTIQLVKKNGDWLISRTDDRACSLGS